MTFKRKIVAGGRRLLHTGALAAVLPGASRFERALARPELAQRARLAEVLSRVSDTVTSRKYDLSPDLSPAEFRARVPETRYEDYADTIEKQRESGARLLTNTPCDRYQPTRVRSHFGTVLRLDRSHLGYSSP